jgi:hypothetical protein
MPALDRDNCAAGKHFPLQKMALPTNIKKSIKMRGRRVSIFNLYFGNDTGVDAKRCRGNKPISPQTLQSRGGYGRL